MAGTTNILQFNPTQANQESDAAYLADAIRTGGAGVDGIWPSNSANKTLYQISAVVAALAQMMANKGFSISDANYSVLVTQLSNILTTADLQHGVQALAWSSSITLNAAAFAAFAVPLQGATTLLVTGATAGQVCVVIYTQDSVGGHAVTFGSGFGAGAAQPDPTPGTTSVQVFIANGAAILTAVSPLISSGGVNNTPIGNSSPSTGAFSALTCPTRIAGDSTVNAATTAFVQAAPVVAGALYWVSGSSGMFIMPSWLGGIHVEWGVITFTTVGYGNFHSNYITAPAVILTPTSASVDLGGPATTSSFVVSGTGTCTVNWLAIGK